MQEAPPGNLEHSIRPTFDAVKASALIVFGAVAAVAFATALRPRGYHNGSSLATALLAGAAIALLLVTALVALRPRVGLRGTSRVTYVTLAFVATLFLGAAAVRTVTAQDGESAKQAFHRWASQATPLLVRYEDALMLDGGRSSSLPRGGARTYMARRVRQVELRLKALELPVGRLAASAPAELKPFVPLLQAAISLAEKAQGTLADALTHTADGPRLGRRQHPSPLALLRAGELLLVRSRQAMAAFALQVNSVGGRLFNG